jgi:hypothetical protein
MDDIKKNKYKVLKNFLSKDELSLTKEYMKIIHFKNTKSFDVIQNNCGDTCFYKDPLTESFLIKKKSIVEEVLKLELYETYSFWRCYTYNADLKPHIDRPSCEYSVTVNVGSDCKWPIFIEDIPITIDEGDGIVYKGMDDKHWRENFKGDYNLQFFLHYVNKNGPYAEHRYDSINLNSI